MYAMWHVHVAMRSMECRARVGCLFFPVKLITSLSEGRCYLRSLQPFVNIGCPYLTLTAKSLRCRHNGGDSVSKHKRIIVYSTVYSDADQRKHQSYASLAFGGEFTGEFPAQMASNAEKVSIWWHHHLDWGCKSEDDVSMETDLQHNLCWMRWRLRIVYAERNRISSIDSTTVWGTSVASAKIRYQKNSFGELSRVQWNNPMNLHIVGAANAPEPDNCVIGRHSAD